MRTAQRTLTILLALLLAAPAHAAETGPGRFPAGAAAAHAGHMPGNSKPVKIRLLFGQVEVIVEMSDNPASRDFLSLLPLRLEFGDYAGVEKIAYLPRRLFTEGAPTASNATGDFTYYAPWGNLAVFYKGFGSDGQLYVLGRIASGKGELAGLPEKGAVKIEKIE